MSRTLHMQLRAGVTNPEATKSLSSPLIATPEAQGESKIKLVLKLRLGAMLGQLAVIWPAVALDWVQTENVASYLSIVGALGVITMLTYVGMHRGWIRKTQRSLLFQLSIDSLALSFFLIMSGGPWNPFVALFFFHAALGALLLRGLWLTAYTVIKIWCLALVHWASLANQPAILQSMPSAMLFPIQSFLLILFGGLLLWASLLLQKNETLLVRVREEKDKIDRLRAFGVIATGFSHKLATPLATLSLKLHRLKRLEVLDDSEDLAFALEALKQAEHSLKTILTQRFLPPEEMFVPLELSTELSRLVKEWDSKRGIVALEVSCQQAMISCPPVSFTQVIIDLLDNAYRANKDYGAHSIRVILTCSHSFVELQIIDVGPGFPQVIMDNLGQPFFSTKPEGVGLGLYHASVLSEILRGELLIRNNPIAGATVTLRLPLITPQQNERAL